MPQRPGQKTMARKDEYGNPLKCFLPECNGNVQARGLCNKHYQQQREGSMLRDDYEKMSICPIPGCGKYSGRNARTCKQHNKVIFRYGLSLERLIELFTNPKCQICLDVEDLVIDHDHSCCPNVKFLGHKISCGECVRGLLCRKCNSALGMLSDNPQRIQGLIDYLIDYESTR